MLLLIAKRKPGVTARLHLRKISPQLKADLEKHNCQYPLVETHISSTAHDRFMLIDNSRLYHIGASLKDLGKKCFAFSLMDEKLIAGFADKIRNKQND